MNIVHIKRIKLKSDKSIRKPGGGVYLLKWFFGLGLAASKCNYFTGGY